MKYPVILIVLITAAFALLIAQPEEYNTLKLEAERYFAEGSYARANELYQKASSMNLTPVEALWVKFRLADTKWRSLAATETPDEALFEGSRKQLEVILESMQREEERTMLWAEVQESLGDFWWLRANSRNWQSGWQQYQSALDWWAGSEQIETARERYLQIIWKMAKPPRVDPYYYYGYYGNMIPAEVLDNALRIAVRTEDKVHLHYLLAMTLRQQGDWNFRKRVVNEFESALKGGKSSEWYDDALYHYAEWLTSNGRAIRIPGGWRQEPDYVRALELYQILITQHAKGETRYFDHAKQRIAEITTPSLTISVSNLFIPGSEIQYQLGWRNIKSIELSLYAVDLTTDMRMSPNSYAGNWLEQLQTTGRTPLKKWTMETGDKGDHRNGQQSLRYENPLTAGAYLLKATAGNVAASDLILVTDATLVSKFSGQKALLYFCSSDNGAPISGARISLWQKKYDGQQHVWQPVNGQTDKDGIFTANIGGPNHSELFAAASAGNPQAFVFGTAQPGYASQSPWKIYAFTDRPAYRPNEEARWKIIARQYDGSTYSTPSNSVVMFEITDPQGAKIKEGSLRLNTFGSAWDSAALTETMPLGEYRITFWDQGKRNHIGQATLFRIEEYKLPEFKVSVQLPEEDGKKKAFVTGETVSVEIHADYYFGGPVADAGVEVLVYQNPFYHGWYPPHEYPWFYEDMQPRQSSWYGGGQVIKRETLKTDASGKATLSFETPANQQQSFEYRVEARVTDASRREITGSETVRVATQRYFVYPHPDHYLYRPQDVVSIQFKAIDANNQPVQATGVVKVTRDFWFEIWLDPNGKEVKGTDLERLKDRIGIFPPAPPEGGTPWRLKFRGYQHDEILTRSLVTDKDGSAELNFTPQQDGYYRVHWDSKDDETDITGETTVWVATNATTEMGYRYGGVQIIVDKDTFRAGQKVPVLISAPANDRYALFSVEGAELYHYQLVHLTGTVKLVELQIDDSFVPNVFLSAVLVSDRQLLMDSKQVIVPPAEHFLNVEVKADREEYQPGEEGTLTVTTKDHNGKPVPAEVGLGLVDESVYYIQQDYSGDPREFYFGQKRPQLVQTQSTLQHRSYPAAEGKLQAIGAIGGSYYDFDAMEAVDNITVMAESPAVDAKKSRSEIAGGVAGAMMQKTAAAPPAPSEAPLPESAVQVRSDFRSTIFWQPDVVTDNNGEAKVKVTYPDSLTGWKATARVATSGSQFGIATAGTRTKKPLIARLQAPRFFVAGDTVTISAVINNNTDQPLNVTPSLKAEGLVVDGASHVLSIKPNSEARVDWTATVPQPGLAKLTVTARSPQYTDGMEKTYVVYEHGIEKLAVKSGKVRGDDVTVTLQIPKERKPESTELTVQVTPSLAVTMLDALPYLINYPYGCTEQTMSRFLPSVITAKTLKDLGMDADSVFDFGGIEKQSASKTHPDGRKNLGKLTDMVKGGLSRIYDFQHPDGGWGWWKEGESDHFMTAYVFWGLSLAKESGTQINSGVMDRARLFLENEIVEEEENYDQQAWMLHALTSDKREIRSSVSKAFTNLWNNRDRLNAYTRALLALSAHSMGRREEAQVLIRNLENGVKIDSAPDKSILVRGASSGESVMATAHWGEDGLYWRWSDGGVEATAFALRALLAIDPQNKLTESVTNWLIKNRRGAQWSNTRDTAIVVLTMNDYLRKSGELAADLEYELLVNGQSISRNKITPSEILQAPSRFSIKNTLVRDGNNEIRIRRISGTGPLYFSAEAKYFSLEEPVTASGNEIFVQREYFKLVGKPTLLKGTVYERQPFRDGDSIHSGERVEVVLRIEAKNNYEYLVFEDLKPAGLEAVAVRSGEPLYARELSSAAKMDSLQPDAQDFTDRSRWVYQELRDRKVALFIDKLPQGIWEIRYDLRAEVPGNFHALPLLGHAMYVPEIRANSQEIRIRVVE